jgi:hypothetical protein
VSYFGGADGEMNDFRMDGRASLFQREGSKWAQGWKKSRLSTNVNFVAARRQYIVMMTVRLMGYQQFETES